MSKRVCLSTDEGLPNVRRRVQKASDGVLAASTPTKVSKRKSCRGIRVASHREVYLAIRRHKIHVAQELYDLAQRQAAAGDHELLFYCTGENLDAKKNLQKVVDTAWAEDVGLVGMDAASCGIILSRQGTESAELLTGERLSIIQQRARSGDGGKIDVCEAEAMSLKSEIDSAAAAQLCGIRYPGRGMKKYVVEEQAGEFALFDRYGLRAEIVVRPLGGRWRLRDLFEIIAVARGSEPALAGASPLPKLDGGISVPRTQAGWRAMLRAGVATPRVHFSELTASEHNAAACELRLGFGCGALPSCRSLATGGTGVMDRHTWIEEMPKREDFELDTFGDRVLSEERLVMFHAVNHVEGRHMGALLRAIKACGHAIQQTIGFKVGVNGGVQIKGNKNFASRHSMKTASFCLQNAKACALEEEEERRRLRLGEQSRIPMCPLMHRSFKQRMPLARSLGHAIRSGRYAFPLKGKTLTGLRLAPSETVASKTISDAAAVSAPSADGPPSSIGEVASGVGVEAGPVTPVNVVPISPTTKVPSATEVGHVAVEDKTKLRTNNRKASLADSGRQNLPKPRRRRLRRIVSESEE